LGYFLKSSETIVQILRYISLGPDQQRQALDVLPFQGVRLWDGGALLLARSALTSHRLEVFPVTVSMQSCDCVLRKGKLHLNANLVGAFLHFFAIRRGNLSDRNQVRFGNFREMSSTYSPDNSPLGSASSSFID